MSKLNVPTVAKLLGVDALTVRYLIDSKEVDWGISIKKPRARRKQYIIFADKFTEATGIKLADNRDTFV